MNEVESPPAPEETQVWVQPRVVKPSKPKKTPAINFMSESMFPTSGVPVPSHLCQGLVEKGSWAPGNREMVGRSWLGCDTNSYLKMMLFSH